MRRKACACALASLLMAGAALAAEGPDAGIPKKPAAGGVTAGTTIVGEQESAIGLYLTPWKDEHAAVMSRPPALLDEPAASGNSGLQSQPGSYNDIAAYQRERFRRNH